MPVVVARDALAPTGVLRAGINLANRLLVSGTDAAGAPSGIAPDVARELARHLGVEMQLVPFKSPAELADAVDADMWDIGLIGADPNRAEKIAFTAAYVEIPAAYLVQPGSALASIDDVDRSNVRIASMAGAAFDLWLQRNIKRATLLRETTLDAASEVFARGGAEVLASTRQRLASDASKVPGSTILDGSFMTIQQAVGLPRCRAIGGLNVLMDCLEDMKASGFVSSLIEKHGVSGSLQVAPCTTSRSADSAAKRQRCEEAPVADMHRGMKIAVLGCGAMGSIYAGLLASSGENEVWAVDVWQEHVAAIRERGLRVEGASGDRTVRLRATTDVTEVGRGVDLAIVATKASGVSAAAQAAAGLLAEDGVVLTIQNGLGSGDRIARHVDDGRVLLGIASNFGASMKGPGHTEHKSMSLICIGEMRGGVTERLERVVRLWSKAGFTVKGSPDIHKMIWEKFICNCTYSGAATVTGKTVGEVQDCPEAWRVALGCAREAYAVARARGIALDFDDVEEHVRRFGATVRAARPSMLQDHEARRRSEVDAINGAVPLEAAKVGLTAPINQTVADIVRARESTF